MTYRSSRMMRSISRRFTGNRRVGYPLLLVVLAWGGTVYYRHNRLHAASLVTPYPTPDISIADEIEKSRTNDYEDRLRRYRDVCSSRQKQVNSYQYGYTYTNPAINVSLSYCIVPKAGCTFWAKLFMFMNRTNGIGWGIESPFDRTRFQVHNPKSIKHTMRHRLEGTVDFFFVRNPYSRLMSAYVDKIVLPQSLQEQIVSRFLEQNSTDKYLCLKEVISFQDFIEKVVFGFGSTNPHWSPIHTSCDPCKILPRFIGKQETFFEDATFLLDSAGLGSLLKHHPLITNIYNDIIDLVDFVYNTYETTKPTPRCYNKTGLAARLWLAIQYNGYLPFHLEFPRDYFENELRNILGITEVIDFVTEYFIHAVAGLGPVDDKAQRKLENMVSLFSSLPRDTMEQVADLFDEDFKMYGYEKYPKNLFPWK